MARQGTRMCRICQRPTLHEQPSMSTGWGCLLTILTSGLFLLVWIPMAIWDSMKKWRCQTCGAKN